MTSEGIRIQIHRTPELECSATRLDHLSTGNLICTSQPKGLVSQGQVITLACTAVSLSMRVCTHMYRRGGVVT